MEKIFWFIVVIVIGTGAVLVLPNQVIKTREPISPTPNPSPVLSVPNVQKSPETPTPTPIQITINPEILNASISATIKTSKGDIKLDLYGKDAPNTVINFLTKAKSGFYNNLTFHRVEGWVVQGGDPKGDGTGGGNIPVEFNSKPFIVGSLGVASRGDGKIQNDAQFFITKQDASWLNNQYTNFGIVTTGMDVVEKIEVGDRILEITVE